MYVPNSFALKNEDNLTSLPKAEHLLKFSVLPSPCWPQFAQELSQDWPLLSIMWEVASRKEKQSGNRPSLLTGME